MATSSPGVAEGVAQQKLGEVATVVRGLSWKKAEESTDGIPVVTIPNVRGGVVSLDCRYRIEKNIPEARRLNRGDILLVGSSGSARNVGRAATVVAKPSEPTTFASFLIRAAARPGLDQSYLFEVLTSGAIDFVRCSKRAADGKYNLQLDDLRGATIPVPPVERQREIAGSLAAAKRAVDAGERGARSFREFRQSMLDHLLSSGPQPGTETSETAVGPLPEAWAVVALGELLESGPRNGLYKPQSAYGAGTPIVRIEDFENEGETISTAGRRVDISKVEQERFGLAADDLILNRVNSLSHLGKVAIVHDLAEPTVFESNMMCFRVDPAKANPLFVFHALRSPLLRRQIRAKSKRAVAQSSINQGDVRGLLVPLPPLPQQEQIVSAIKAIDTRIQAEDRRVGALSSLWRSLLFRLVLESANGAVGESSHG